MRRRRAGLSRDTRLLGVNLGLTCEHDPPPPPPHLNSTTSLEFHLISDNVGKLEIYTQSLHSLSQSLLRKEGAEPFQEVSRLETEIHLDN